MEKSAQERRGKKTFGLLLTRETQWVDVEVRITACRDPRDDKFLEIAVSGQGRYACFCPLPQVIFFLFGS